MGIAKLTADCTLGHVLGPADALAYAHTDIPTQQLLLDKWYSFTTFALNCRDS